jgi:hypothetical protein
LINSFRYGGNGSGFDLKWFANESAKSAAVMEKYLKNKYRSITRAAKFIIRCKSKLY